MHRYPTQKVSIYRNWLNSDPTKFRYISWDYSINAICLLLRWITYEEADALAEDFGRGLKGLNPQHEKPVCMFADTRWVNRQTLLSSSHPLPSPHPAGIGGRCSQAAKPYADNDGSASLSLWAHTQSAECWTNSEISLCLLTSMVIESCHQSLWQIACLSVFYYFVDHSLLLCLVFPKKSWKNSTFSSEWAPVRPKRMQVFLGRPVRN